MSPSDDELHRLAAQVGERILARGQMLVTAESCTAGWIAKLCTDWPGSSAWYRGGAVVYDDALKVALLGVRPATLAEHGAVSETTAREMATGALAWLGGSLSVAVTGIAGPSGGTVAKPVGTVWVATALDGALEARRVQLPGSREEIRMRAAQAALLLAWRRLQPRSGS